MERLCGTVPADACPAIGGAALAVFLCGAAPVTAHAITAIGSTALAVLLSSAKAVAADTRPTVVCAANAVFVFAAQAVATRAGTIPFAVGAVLARIAHRVAAARGVIDDVLRSMLTNCR